MASNWAVRGITRPERLKRRDVFQAIFQRGKRVERASLLVLWRRWEGPRQVGFAVSRQVRGAVQRNRAKRRLREAYRATSHDLPDGVQLVCVAREPVLEAPFRALQREMLEAFTVVARHLGTVGTR